MIIHYIRQVTDCQKRPIGCVVMDDSGAVGYSLCAPADLHKDTGMPFKARARQIAEDRAKMNLVHIDYEGNWYRCRNGGPRYYLPDIIADALDLVAFHGISNPLSPTAFFGYTP